MSGFTDKGATAELGRQLERPSALRAVGRHPDPALARAIEGWPKSTRARVQRIGLLVASLAAGLRPLTDLFDQFKITVRSRDRSPKHIGHVVGRVRRLAQDCGFDSWTDIQPSAVERHLRALREGGLATKTSIASLRQFTRWAVETGLATEDPLRGLKPLNARVDPQRERRALSDADLRKLIEATRAAPERFGLSGPARALLYTPAAETGLRASELRSLRAASFDLDPPGLP